MTSFNPFPSDIATYSREHLPFTVPANRGYADGDAVGNMDPIEVPPETSPRVPRYPSALTGEDRSRSSSRQRTSNQQPEKRVAFVHDRRPRASSHGASFKKNLAEVLHLSKSSHHDVPDHAANHFRTSSDSNIVGGRPNMNFGFKTSENAIADDDDDEGDNLRLDPRLILRNPSIRPDLVNPSEMDNYILYSSNGLSYISNPSARANPSARVGAAPGSRAAAYNAQVQQQHSVPTYPTTGPPPYAESVYSRSHSHSRSRSPASHSHVARARGLVATESRMPTSTYWSSPIELLNVLKAPVLAVEKPEARLAIIVVEGIVLLMVFNWLMAVLDSGISTVVVLAVGLVFINGLYTKSQVAASLPQQQKYQRKHQQTLGKPSHAQLLPAGLYQ